MITETGKKILEDIIDNYEEFSDEARLGGLLYVNDEVTKMMTKDEAVAFAKKYLVDRIQEDCIDIWDLAIEYVLLDIIPHIYGEALD